MKILHAFVALVVSLFFAAVMPACAHVVPVAGCFESLGSRGIGLLARAKADFDTDNYADLVQIGITDGWPVLSCIIAEVEGKSPALAPKVKAFRAQHAAQLKAS